MSTGAQVTPTRHRAGLAIKVGAALSLSGPFAAHGRQAQRGLALWAADVNAAGGLVVRDRGGPWPVALVIYDDASRSAQVTVATEKLLGDERVDLLIGPYSSMLTLAVAPVAERHGKVLWNHGGASDAVTRAGFRGVVSLLSPASHYFVGLLELVRTCDPTARRVALLHGARGTFPQAVSAGAAAYSRRHGLQVVLQRPYPPPGAGFASLVAHVSACQPDIILGVGLTEADLACARALTAHPVRARAVGLVAAALQVFGHTLGCAARGFLGPSQWEPGLRYQPDLGPTAAEFATRFQARFQTEPEYPAAQAYAAGLVAQRCVEVAGTLRDELLLEAAYALRVTTMYGAFRLDALTGEQAGHRLVVVQWQEEGKRIVWPPALAEATAQIPLLP
jgi:branched-chain amino acid transport system substrate-binding protein